MRVVAHGVVPRGLLVYAGRRRMEEGAVPCGPDGGLAAYVKCMGYLIIGHTEGAEADDFGPKSLI